MTHTDDSEYWSKLDDAQAVVGGWSAFVILLYLLVIGYLTPDRWPLVALLSVCCLVGGWRTIALSRQYRE